eukprot:CAMPEP_0113308670 /NCGR_PEP_ID=MMETSP0010_2-20120614/7024_1 /TAXON_ID=216773 ORGANISM="Corethron hystrix, Strain 308" /NCGR_SAMPLE_ID=MMETSP0010_2 /ASSEMBLY_ACC=CAM_ASM_000155 /LENGTH=334 /DNA_ID=CAMNT_0000163775 /DNA_START=75 /DNA_END=1080 /DNA_ORIENTATION=- /assembly_acc=CAM_ASM_000155
METANTTMQAVHQAGWGGRDQLSVKKMTRPVPKSNDVLVRVSTVSIHAGDHHMLTGRPYFIRGMGRRKIPGMDFAGTVEVVGNSVKTVKSGDRVFGTTDMACGAFAEFVSHLLNNIVHIPESVDFATAAAVPTSAMTALQALRKGRPTEKGDSILINGASGGVGTFAVQLAVSMGARVTGVCSSRNVELVKQMGAEKVIDYTKEDICGEYDRIIDAVGRPPSHWKALLAPEGSLVAVAMPNSESEWVPCQIFRVLCFPFCCCCFLSQKFYFFMQEVKKEDLQELSSMLASGKLKPAIGKHVSGLSKIPDTLNDHSNTLGLGHTSGKTVISIGEK